MKLKLDLHDIFNRGTDIDRALRGIIDEAIQKKATLVEIIPGKGSGQLKKKVLRFLDQKEIKQLYHRVEKDGDNWGRLFVHFRFDAPSGRRGARPLAADHPVPLRDWCRAVVPAVPACRPGDRTPGPRRRASTGGDRASGSRPAGRPPGSSAPPRRPGR